MANTLDNVIPQILAQAMLVLRGAVVMPGLVSTEYQSDAAKKGASIDIPKDPIIATRDVVPGPNQLAAGAINPGVVQIVLDFWKEAPFQMTDNDIMKAQNGTLPSTARSAVASLAADVNAYLFEQYKAVYGFVGTPTTTPFGGSTPTTSDATQCRKLLNIQLAPLMARRMVLDPEAAANALDLGAFQDASKSADAMVISDAVIGRKLGFDWYEDQQTPTHTAGTIASALIAKAATAQAVGTTDIVCTSDDDIDLLEGDIITFAGQNQTYVVTADAARTGAGDITVPVQPGLKVALAGSEAVTLKASHTVNLAFQEGAFAFASRPLADATPPGADSAAIIESVTDPLSGLSLRLEIIRQHKQWEWSFDLLGGAACIDPAKAVRLAG